ncbi:hypothetical protein [Escherichia coli]
MILNKFYQVTFRKKLYGVLDAVGATISTPAEPWTIGPPGNAANLLI